MTKYRGYNIDIIKKKNRYYFEAYTDNNEVYIGDNFGSKTKTLALKEIKKIIDKRISSFGGVFG